MANARIGALRVDLGMNTAAFEKGVGIAQIRINRFAGNLKKVGANMQGIGKKMSMSLTAPLAAVGAAFGKLTHDLARNAKEMQTSADVAGESFEQFQRQAHAAKTVGIEFEKLGDIFKDVRDRVGDFAATGGGPMADFFENIAPKVGLTQEAFKGLSGKDGLQLYYNSLVKAGASQEEIVFYMEAMASDATNLIPLLEQNGKAMKELGENATIIDDGDAESLKRYTDAQVKMGQAVRALTIALVDSGLLDTITSMVTKVAEWTKGLSETNPTLLKVAVGVGAVVAILGPLVAIAGTVVSAIGGVIGVMSPLLAVIGTAAAAGGPLVAFKVAMAGLAGIMAPLATGIGLVGKAMLLLLANPIILGAAALIGGIYLAWKNWDKIKPVIDRIAKVVSEFWSKWVQPVFSAIANGLVTGVSAWFNWHKNIILFVAKMVNGVKTWLVDKLYSILGGVIDKIKTVSNAFFDMYDAVVGNSYVPDMVDGIADHMGRLDDVMVRQAERTTKSTKEAFADLANDVRAIMDEVYPNAARLREFRDKAGRLGQARNAGIIDEATYEGLYTGLRSGLRSDDQGGKLRLSASTMQGLDPLKAVEQVAAASDRFQDRMAAMADSAKVQTVRVAETFADMARNTISSLQTLTDAIKGGGFLDILGGVIDLGLNLAGAGLFGSKAQSSVNSFGGFRAEGGPVSFGKSYIVGERGPELFTPSAGGSITPNHAMGGGGTVQVIPSPYFDVVVDGRVERAAPNIAVAGATMANNKAARMQSRRV